MTRVVRDMPMAHAPVQRSSRNSCCCFNTQFITSRPGIFKIIEATFGGICQSLLINYGTGVSLLVGNSYTIFLTNASACLLTTCILLFCYIVSDATFRSIRKSIFEIVFNVVAAWLYLGASSYLLVMTSFFLWPLYIITPFFQAYPALTAASSFGIVLSLIHAIDAYYAIQCYRGKG